MKNGFCIKCDGVELEKGKDGIREEEQVKDVGENNKVISKWREKTE